jgi:two-component system response regulator MprA
MTLEQPSPPPTKKRLLLVDDDQYVRRILAVGLRLEGYEIDQAANGLEGLEKLRAHRADAVIVDLMMPVMDGRAFLQKVREELGAELPILVLTSVDREDATRDLLASGASGILHKPAKVPEILEELRKISH